MAGAGEYGGKDGLIQRSADGHELTASEEAMLMRQLGAREHAGLGFDRARGVLDRSPADLDGMRAHLERGLKTSDEVPERTPELTDDQKDGYAPQ